MIKIARFITEKENVKDVSSNAARGGTEQEKKKKKEEDKCDANGYLILLS